MNEQGKVFRWKRDPATGDGALVHLPVSVYVYYDADDAPLYVGQTTDLFAREHHHRSKSPWWGAVAYREVVSEHDERADALYAEAEEIRRIRPRYNVRHNGAGVA